MEATGSPQAAPQLEGEFLLLEVCCGSGRLAAAVAKKGMSAIGIDFQFNRFEPICSNIRADLRTAGGQDATTEILKIASVCWFSLPASTLTNLRNRPMPFALRNHRPAPTPL